MPTAKLVYSTPLDVAIGAMDNCYGNKCSIKSLLKSVKAGHLSLLEHVTATFDIMCSEAVLKQITRHRHLSPTVESSRGSDITENMFYMHNKEEYGGAILEFYAEDFDDIVDVLAFEKISKIYDELVDCYKQLVNQGVPKEVAAYILPMATQVKMRYTGNMRAWFEYLQKRLCKRASIEHQELAHEIYKELHNAYPDIFNKELLNICSTCKEKNCQF
jgi:thymidylate synthase (FAD)